MIPLSPPSIFIQTLVIVRPRIEDLLAAAFFIRRS